MIEQLKQYKIFENKEIETFKLLENQGYCNENYLVMADGIKYIVRKLLRDDTDRGFEWKVQQLAFEKNITAEPLIFDEVNGFMVFLFLEGEHKGMEVESLLPPKVKSHSAGGSKLSTSKNDLKFLADTLQTLHSIQIDSKPITLHIENKTNEVLKAFETIENHPKEYVLCHNDLNPQNILFTNEVKFIDWEFASVNDRYFDLASVCIEFDLDTKDETYFLEHYFDIREEIYTEKLSGYKAIYKALCAQWFEGLETTLP